MHTFPLPFSDIEQFTRDDKPVITVDYHGGKYQDMAFFNYASNLGIPTIISPHNLTSDEKHALLMQYMTHKNVGIFPNLNAEVADCLLAVVTSPRRLSTEPFLTDEERHAFIIAHMNTMSMWVMFLNSILVFAMDCHRRGLDAQQADPETGVTQPTRIADLFPVIDDADAVGANIVGLFDIPAFMEWFLEKGLLPEAMVYFKYQFNERCFSGRSLYEYVANDKQVFFMGMLAASHQHHKDRERDGTD